MGDGEGQGDKETRGQGEEERGEVGTSRGVEELQGHQENNQLLTTNY
ncbi:hypothetical protein PCC6912_10100 [Chlorogloeopsis fritschii PCC 6912]|uniref:Uncharacterized protein n=1 Tax=Chlorogloeopsis fritschii PCC 6912 TaxID=211165 RepID=A0A3S0XZZ4_CHLFR|nr:hypothetical protein PCC6912_10100 [Chlorogloeopsis fritschii PCC 6912]